MKRRFKKFKIYIYKILIILSLLVLFLVFLFYSAKFLLIYSNIFLVKEIKSNEEISRELEYLKGRSLFDTDIKDIYFKIYKNHPEYKEVLVVKEFPSSIRVEVKLREPFCQLELDKFYILDREGFVIDIKTQQVKNLIPIKLNIKHQIRKGFKISSSDIDRGLKLIEEINKNEFIRNLPINFVDITNPSEICFSIDNIKIFIIEDFKKKLDSLQDIILRELNNNLKSVDYIDLRFNRVYISYKK